ncbi:MAG TPA: GNAT family N-acetyltransferase [Symbiobacteriaceae bacterium]|nr:GNAT family N-acetyltransferase [Symbiobacteriaceae bacterium]
MSVAIRPFAAEYEAILPLANLIGPSPLTTAQLAEQHAQFPADGLRTMLVAVDGAGHTLGYGSATARPTLWPGQFYATVVTAPSARRQGVGAALLEALEGWARANGAVVLRTSLADTDEASAGFFRHRGYALEAHRLVSHLDVPSFDESRFPGVAESSGVTFFRFSDLPRDEAMPRLYELYKVTDMDSPGYAGTDPARYPSFAHWYDEMFSEGNTLEDAIFIAADGDRWVGVTILQKEGEDRVLYTEYTGVLREYRGRSIALALKLLSVQYAKAYGAPYMTTRNDASNAPMLAVNQKMGYYKASGRYWLAKKL